MINNIYIYRPVAFLSALPLFEYADSIGIRFIVPDLHVTLAHSRAEVDWDAYAFQVNPTRLTIMAGGAERMITKFEGGAIVMRIRSPEFTSRWAQLIAAGASWDHDEYEPHITLGNDEDFDVTNVTQMFTPEIAFGGERREALEL